MKTATSTGIGSMPIKNNQNQFNSINSLLKILNVFKTLPFWSKFQNCKKLVNTELQKVDEWMRFNKLSLNYSTSYMLIGPKGNRLYDFTVKINENTISQTNSTKYLGVYIDDKRTWSDHITNLEKSISRSVGIFYRIRHYLNERALKSLYFSIVYSHFQYAKELGVASVRQVFDGWTYCTTK